jgi:hypothetical protein
MKKQSKYDRDREDEFHVEKSTNEAKREVFVAAQNSRLDALINEREKNPGLAYALIKGSVWIVYRSAMLGVTVAGALAKGVGMSVNLLLRLINEKNSKKNE